MHFSSADIAKENLVVGGLSHGEIENQFRMMKTRMYNGAVMARVHLQSELSAPAYRRGQIRVARTNEDSLISQ